MEKRNKEHYGKLEIAKLSMTGTKEKKVKNSPLETRDIEHCETLRLKGRYILKTRRLRKGTKEDQIRTALRLKSDTSLDKMKRT